MFKQIILVILFNIVVLPAYAEDAVDAVDEVEAVDVDAPVDMVATSCPNVTEIPQDECETLIELYNNTYGDTWTDAYSNNWNLTDNPCSWAGIGCTNGHVTSIERIQNNLTGSLPDLSSLLELQILNLSSNKLAGIIPSSLRNLTNLTVLNLKNNQLNSSIPDVSLLTKLQTLELQNNKLENNIPFSV
ncbi:MAG: hypothetical protein IMF12_00800, partial [Proteobacteria bacterium]|nr:hypothetical protein [Pseudomonadota bacterium]